MMCDVEQKLGWPYAISMRAKVEHFVLTLSLRHLGFGAYRYRRKAFLAPETVAPILSLSAPERNDRVFHN